jgi:hypothetical protein
VDDLRGEEYFELFPLESKNMLKKEYYHSVAKTLAQFHNQNTMDFDKTHLFDKVFNKKIPVFEKVA